MAWIESHQTLQRHPKVFRLAARVRACRPQIIGHLHILWWWALDYAPTGNVSAFTPAEIADASEWSGDADLWLAALKQTNWIDEDGMLHDWYEYAGKLIVERERDRERKRASRLSSKLSAGHPSDVHPPSRVPNPTQPNPTVHKRRAVGAHPGFEKFWQAYPNKVGKRASETKWNQLKPPIEQCLAAIAHQKSSDKWRKEGGQYIPNPLTWLNQGRWEDAPSVEVQKYRPAADKPVPADPAGWKEWRDKNYPDADKKIPFCKVSLEIQKQFNERKL